MMGYNTRKPEVLLSIVTWNHEKSIKATIDSIYNQTYACFKLVVFDNNSSDTTVSLLKDYCSRPNFELIEGRDNIGFCGGHNYVISSNEFDYLFLVNPDIVLRPDYIDQTLKVFAIDPRIGAVCGLLVQSFDENPVIDSAGLYLTKSRRFVSKHHGHNLNAVQLKSGYVPGLDGALPAFRSEAVESLLINGEFFNSLFFSHKEDWDISWRLILFNWKTFFNKDSVAIHPRYFKPNNLKERLKIGAKIKYDAFKNQFLLLLINEDKKNFIRDAFVIIPRMLAATFYCLLFERHSLKAYGFIVTNRGKILSLRKQVQARRQISYARFREFINENYLQ